MTPPTTTMPTWRQRLRRWTRPPRRLTFTRLGKWYVGLTLFLGLAAINTGNNLLFLLLGLLLAGIVLSGVLSESTLRDLEVQRVLPLEARAGQPVLVGLRVTNAKRRASSYAVVARDRTEKGRAGSAFVLSLAGGETREVSYRWEPERRGPVRFVTVELATRFPFGLFEKWREFDLPSEMVVFPREVPAPPLVVQRASPVGERPSGDAGPGSEFFGLRDVRTGDDRRSIHWPTTARRGRPVVVERERERRRRLALSVDNRLARTVEDVDRLAEAAAALLKRAVHEGCEVGLAASEVTIGPSAGAAHERRILRALALLQPSPDGAAPVRIAGAEVVPVAGAPAPAAASQEAA